ncbi:Pentatricopeptide repeat [Macleaya cordata]|uniref:Pentatricopeptide repeat n=1 Tax=Macleaya cordata TaxID=56857 RepID=A0A200QJM9_MACCD|nr:Pentatricopeptide repeat [Macleaya cordata]
MVLLNYRTIQNRIPGYHQVVGSPCRYRCRSIHSSGFIEEEEDTNDYHDNDNGNQISNSTTATKDSDDDRNIAIDSEKLCKILSKNHHHYYGGCGSGSSTSSSSSSSGIIESALDHSGIKVVSPALVEQVLKKLSNVGALALSFFRWAEKQQGFKHTTATYNALIEALGKIKQFKLIWDTVHSMKLKGLLTRDTFGLIERRYARARKPIEAVEAFEKMAKFGLKPELSDFNTLIGTLCKSGQVRKAQELFDEMVKRKKRFEPDLKTYTILLDGWGTERNLVLLKKAYTEMRDEGGLEPDVVTFGIIINAYCKSRKYDEALELLREIEANKKCKPSPHIYCTLISGLGSEKRLNEALEIFERSKAVNGSPPEVPTYNAVVRSFCWSMRLHDAYQVVEEMRRNGVGPTSRTYDIILHHLIKARRMKEAYSVFQRMGSEFGCEPNLNTYTMIVRMLCEEEERVDMAIKVWDQMKDKGILPSMHMFSALINSLCHENRLDDACKYFQEMLDLGIRPPGQLYSNLKQALLDAGKKDVALDLGLKLDKIRKIPLIR